MTRRRFWEEPGFRFFTPEMQAFMGGYEPILANRIINDKKAAAAQYTATLTTTQKDAGTRGGWGRGSIQMPKTPTHGAPGAMRRRKESS